MLIGGGSMNKTMRLAMLNQSNRNNNNRNNNDYRGNQIGFRYDDGSYNADRREYDRYIDYDRNREWNPNQFIAEGKEMITDVI